jgi:hypothetical protein
MQIIKIRSNGCKYMHIMLVIVNKRIELIVIIVQSRRRIGGD